MKTAHCKSGIINTIILTSVFTAIAILPSNKIFSQTIDEPNTNKTGIGAVYKSFPSLLEGAKKVPDELTQKRLLSQENVPQNMVKAPVELTQQNLPGQASVPQGAIKGPVDTTNTISAEQEIATNPPAPGKPLITKDSILERLGADVIEKHGISVDEDTVHLILDYKKDINRKISRRWGISGSVAEIIKYINPVLYAQFLNERKLKNGGAFYLVMKCTGRSCGASIGEELSNCDLWDKGSLEKTDEIRIPFEGKFGLLELANYPMPEAVPVPEVPMPIATPIPEVPKVIIEEQKPAVPTAISDTICISLLFDLTDLVEQKEKGLYYHKESNYMLDFRPYMLDNNCENAAKMQELYNNWLAYKKELDATNARQKPQPTEIKSDPFKNFRI